MRLGSVTSSVLQLYMEVDCRRKPISSQRVAIAFPLRASKHGPLGVQQMSSALRPSTQLLQDTATAYELECHGLCRGPILLLEPHIVNTFFHLHLFQPVQYCKLNNISAQPRKHAEPSIPFVRTPLPTTVTEH